MKGAKLKSTHKKNVSRAKVVAVRSEVSQYCDILGWKFKVFESSVGSKALQKTIDELDETVRLSFKTSVRYLSNTPKRDWKKPHARKLKGVEDVFEIRFSASNVQYRPLGFFGPNVKEFTILVWSTHKQNIYDPHDAINTSDKRRKSIKKGDAHCVPLKIDGEELPCSEEC